MHNYYRYRGTNWGAILIVLFIAVFALAILAMTIGSVANRITDEQAIHRFQEIKETKAVVIIRKSNDAPIIGNWHDVNYELRINDKIMSGRCVAATFSPMICRLYGQGEGE